MMFAHLEPIQAKAEGTFAGSTPSSGAGRGLYVRGEAAHEYANPVAVCCNSPLKPATTELAFEDVKARTLIGSE